MNKLVNENLNEIMGNHFLAGFEEEIVASMDSLGLSEMEIDKVMNDPDVYDYMLELLEKEVNLSGHIPDLTMIALKILEFAERKGLIQNERVVEGEKSYYYEIVGDIVKSTLITDRIVPNEDNIIMLIHDVTRDMFPEMVRNLMNDDDFVSDTLDYIQTNESLNETSLVNMYREMGTWFPLKRDLERKAEASGITTENSPELEEIVDDWSSGMYDEDPEQIFYRIEDMIMNESLNEEYSNEERESVVGLAVDLQNILSEIFESLIEIDMPEEDQQVLSDAMRVGRHIEVRYSNEDYGIKSVMPKNESLNEGFATEEGRKLDRIAGWLGYDDLQEMLGDNPGLFDACLEWIDQTFGEQLVQELYNQGINPAEIEKVGLWNVADEVKRRYREEDNGSLVREDFKGDFKGDTPADQGMRAARRDNARMSNKENILNFLGVEGEGWYKYKDVEEVIPPETIDYLDHRNISIDDNLVAVFSEDYDNYLALAKAVSRAGISFHIAPDEGGESDDGRILIFNKGDL